MKLFKARRPRAPILNNRLRDSDVSVAEQLLIFDYQSTLIIAHRGAAQCCRCWLEALLQLYYWTKWYSPSRIFQPSASALSSRWVTLHKLLIDSSVRVTKTPTLTLCDWSWIRARGRPAKWPPPPSSHKHAPVEVVRETFGLLNEFIVQLKWNVTWGFPDILLFFSFFSVIQLSNLSLLSSPPSWTDLNLSIQEHLWYQ